MRIDSQLPHVVASLMIASYDDRQYGSLLLARVVGMKGAESAKLLGHRERFKVEWVAESLMSRKRTMVSTSYPEIMLDHHEGER